MGWRSPCLNVGWEPETTEARGGTGSHYQFFFKRRRSQQGSCCGVFILFRSVFDWRLNIAFRDICFKNDLVAHEESSRCKSAAIICMFSVRSDCSKWESCAGT